MTLEPPLDISGEVLRVRVPVATVWTGPGAPRDIDAPAVADEPDVAAWTAAMDAGVRKGLAGRTLTQLLLGDSVQVLEHAGDWVRVVCPAQPSSADSRGYPGWVRRAHLVAPPRGAQPPTAFVAARQVPWIPPSGPELWLSYGTALSVVARSGDGVTVLLPDGRRGEVPREGLRLVEEGEAPAYRPVDLLDAARRFLGLRYLWGGTSAWGLDCSGLVHLVHRAHGVVVPRDAFDQAQGRHIEPVPLDEVQPGDLYFFARPGERIYHVGFVSRPVAADGTRFMLHAPEGGELIEDAPLAPHRVATLLAAGRVREPVTAPPG